ncbi:MAG: efflux RND transporter periplasmic adaptor subunit [Anaerolineaceae bacterium]|nr:efflux RND transporter periplasmic adaptor subunit [Anaerolineaceae bacterium]MCB9101253.1 efflux RND transporter periplasmic adaptor subunit [Anaerolineales bacterium]
MKRILFTMVILAVLAAAGWYGYQTYLAPAEPKSLAEDPGVEIITVGSDTIEKTVSATGSIEPEAEVDMKFETGGTVEEVLVKQGQVITAGAILARLDTTDLERSVRSAQIDLDQAEANLKQLSEPELAEKITAAQTSIESAQLNLADLQDGPDPDDVTKAEVSLKQTEITLQEAQWAYDQVSYRGDVGAMSQSNDLQDATLAYESAVADYNLAVKEATPAELASARSTLASAKSSLAELLQEPSAAEIAAQQANVDKAQLNLEEALANLNGADLVAPTGGVVLQVNIEPGERVMDDADDAALTIADTSTYLLKMEVDELDIGQVRQGQKAAVTLDSFVDQTFDGTVTDISPSPSSEDADSIVTYEVTITLDTPGDSIGFLTGMTASANIETEVLDDAVVVPTRAIQSEQIDGEAVTYVETLDSQGNATRMEIETGLRSGSMTEVTAGLEPGDQVVIRQQTELGL